MRQQIALASTCRWIRSPSRRTSFPFRLRGGDRWAAAVAVAYAQHTRPTAPRIPLRPRRLRRRRGRLQGAAGNSRIVTAPTLPGGANTLPQQKGAFRDLWRDQVMQFEDAHRRVHRGADRFQHGFQVLLLVAAQILFRLPDLRDKHRPVDLGGAMHDEPERMLAVEVDPGCGSVVKLAPRLPPADPKNRHSDYPLDGPCGLFRF